MYNDPTNEQTAFGGVKKRDNVDALVRRMKAILADPEATEEAKKVARKGLIDNDLCLKHHSYHARRAMIRQVASFREEYVKKRNQSQIDAPGTKYLAEREEARKKAAEAAKRPAQAMSSTRSKPPTTEPMSDHENRLWNNKRPKNTYVGGTGDPVGPVTLPDGRVIMPTGGAMGQLISNGPEQSESFCQVCNISFCGPIPAQQHYAGKKHEKKLKVYKFEKSNEKTEEEEVAPTKVGLNLDYCELCELKLSPNPIQATGHYSSPGHLKYLGISKESPGLPGKSSLQRKSEQRRYTGTWVDNIKVSDCPSWGAARMSRMGTRVKFKGCAAGPGVQPLPGEHETTCQFCSASFTKPLQALNHYMGKKHQTRLIQTACRPPPPKFNAPSIVLDPGQRAHKICTGFSV